MSLRNFNEALTLITVPPANVCNVTAAADVWLTKVMTSPAAKIAITCPLFCCVPAPDPYTVPAIGSPFWNNANWFGSTPETEKSILYVPAVTITTASAPGVCVIPDVITPLVLNNTVASNATTCASKL